MKAEARQAREAQQTAQQMKQTVNVQRSAQSAAEAKRNDEIRMAEELKRKADADLASAKRLSLELEKGKKAQTKQTMNQQNSSNNQQDTKGTSHRRTTASGSGFAASSKREDVVVLNDPEKNAINMPQVLEGSLKDLLQNDPRQKTRRNKGNNNY